MRSLACPHPFLFYCVILYSHCPDNVKRTKRFCLLTKYNYILLALRIFFQLEKLSSCVRNSSNKTMTSTSSAGEVAALASGSCVGMPLVVATGVVREGLVVVLSGVVVSPGSVNEGVVLGGMMGDLVVCRGAVVCAGAVVAVPIAQFTGRLQRRGSAIRKINYTPAHMSVRSDMSYKRRNKP